MSKFKVGDIVEMDVYVCPKFSLPNADESAPVPPAEEKTIVGKVQSANEKQVTAYWENGTVTTEEPKNVRRHVR